MAKKDEKTVQTQEQAQAAETTAPAPAAKKGDNPVDIFRDALMKTKREGMTDLLDFIQDIGFLEIILPSLIQRTGIIKKCAFAV